MAWKLPEFKTVVAGFIGAVIAIQVISLLISSVFTNVPVLHAGTPILIIILGVGLITLFITGFNVERLKNKENLLFVLIVFGLVIASYVYLPKYLPQIFSIEFSNSIKQSLGAIFYP